MLKTHHPLNFSPFATNVLDCVGRNDLQTPDGRPVIIENLRGFVVSVDGQIAYESGNNLSVSYFLNTHEVGILG